MKRIARRVVLDCLGYLFLILGLIGLVMPFLQGIIFVFLGLAILSLHAEWGRSMMQWCKERHPLAAKYVTKAENFLKRFVGEATNNTTNP